MIKVTHFDKNIKNYDLDNIYKNYNLNDNLNKISQLDNKISLIFFDKNIPNKKLKIKPNIINDNNIIWTIDNFLSIEECNNIIDRCNDIGFQKTAKSSDARSRLLTFDLSGCLLNGIQNRLKESNVPSVIEAIDFKKPYGITKNTDWYNNGDINPCFRITKYETG